MSKPEDRPDAEACAWGLVLLLLTPALAAWAGWIVWLGWDWWLAPIGWPVLPYGQAVGLTLLVDVLMLRTPHQKPTVSSQYILGYQVFALAMFSGILGLLGLFVR